MATRKRKKHCNGNYDIIYKKANVDKSALNSMLLDMLSGKKNDKQSENPQKKIRSTLLDIVHSLPPPLSSPNDDNENHHLLDSERLVDNVDIDIDTLNDTLNDTPNPFNPVLRNKFNQFFSKRPGSCCLCGETHQIEFESQNFNESFSVNLNDPKEWNWGEGMFVIDQIL